MEFALTLLAWQARVPGVNELEEWQAWAHKSGAPDVGSQFKKPVELPMMVARRLGDGSKQAIECGLILLRQQPDIEAVVYTSRHGELARNYKILQSLAAKQAVSPTDFTMSVHNSTVGHLTIISKKSLVASSVSAGMDTFQQGVLEVMSLLSAGYKKVLLVDFEDTVPDFYHAKMAVEIPKWPYAVGLVFEQGKEFKCNLQTAASVAEPELPQSLLFLRHYLLGNMTFKIPGERLQWSWQRT